MVSMMQLWLPIVLSAVGVFIASSLIHMVFKWHNSDYLKLGNEDEVRAAIRKTSPAPGQYVMPYCQDMKQMQMPEMQQKYTEGPIGFVMLKAPGKPNMGPMLGQWFVLSLVIAAVTACVAACALSATAAGGQVFDLVATVTVLAYAGGSVSSGIWMAKPWRSVAKEVLDAVIYGLVSGAIFCWLWPHA